jgi:excisionase family DNA binding protein
MVTAEKMPELLTRAEAARLLRCSLPTLDKYLRAEAAGRRLPSYRPSGRILIRADDLESWLAQHPCVRG